MQNFCMGDAVICINTSSRHKGKTGTIIGINHKRHHEWTTYSVKWDCGGVNECDSEWLGLSWQPLVDNYKVTISDNSGPMLTSYDSWTYKLDNPVDKIAERYAYQFHEELEEEAKKHLKKLGWVAPEDTENLKGRYKEDCIHVVQEIKKDTKDLLCSLADEVFEEAYMNLTRHKAEELKELVLAKANEINID